MVRYLVSALIAVTTLFATFYGLAKTVGHGSPTEIPIVGQLELLAPSPAAEPRQER